MAVLLGIAHFGVSLSRCHPSEKKKERKFTDAVQSKQPLIVTFPSTTSYNIQVTVSYARGSLLSPEKTNQFAVSKDLKPCGNIPQKITKQAARLKYLSTCNWKRYTEGQVIAYYGRDKDITLTCWGQGTDGVLNNP